ncbi:MAG TPA: ABC transporter ATP-binding protein [Propionibacteriaceae bacterium]|nr:ABC transporter ATP-binding protein [Propionibacteriaceae bacterium]
MAKPVTTGASLAVRDLSFTVGGVRILDKVNLEVGAGEFLGVIGPNGAGKTTLFNVLSGLLTETGGEARLDGREITGLPVFARARAGLGRTFQTSSVFPRLSALENVRLAAEADAGGSLRIWGGTGSTLGFAQECLDRVGLGARAGRPAGSLSHGDKRKLEIAIVLATSPQLLMLDEPMAGLGMEDVPEISDLVRSLHRDNGITVLMVEHHIEVLFGLADRIAVMQHGRLISCDAPDAVMADPLVQAAYLGDEL